MTTIGLDIDGGDEAAATPLPLADTASPQRPPGGNPSLTTALCVSLTLHGLGLSAVAWWFVLHEPPPHWPAIDREAVARVVLPPPPLPRPTPPRRRPRPAFEVPPPQFKDDSGEHDARGTANRSTDGERPMFAPAGHPQADLVRSAAFDPMLIDPTARRAAQAGEAVPSDALPLTPTPPRAGVDQPQFVADGRAARRTDEAARPGPAGVGPMPPSPPLAMPAELSEAEPAPTGARRASAERATTAVPPAPPPRRARGRQATPSDTDSVALADAETTVTFHAGKVVGRQGMKVQFTRPHFGLASESDLSTIGGLHATFGADVRTDGTVADVTVLQTSGSANVDEDCRRSIYASTFEPNKGKDGQPVETRWTVVYD